jgi:hypothetical protein
MKKKETIDEIDLVDTFLIIWKKKLTVSLFIIFSIIITFTTQTNQSPSKEVATTEIREISVYDETKYKIYNLFINTITPSYMKKGADLSNKDETGMVKQGNQERYFTVPNRIEENLVINNIKKEFLFRLFTDLIQDKSYLQDLLKKFQFIKEEDYSNMYEYNKAINKIANSIDLLNLEVQDLENNSTPIVIKFVSIDVQKWEIFLEYLEKQTNLRIQKKLSDMLESYINYVNVLKKFKINDLNSQLEAVNLKEEQRVDIERTREFLQNDKYVDQLKDIFSTSPLSNAEDFYAAKILINSTKYKLADERSSKFIVFIIASLLGAIIGIFFVLLANAIQNRR